MDSISYDEAHLCDQCPYEKGTLGTEIDVQTGKMLGRHRERTVSTSPGEGLEQTLPHRFREKQPSRHLDFGLQVLALLFKLLGSWSSITAAPINDNFHLYTIYFPELQ